MRFVIFTHSLVSDWNHGNAHFLRGIASELLARGHQLRILEPADGWSRQNLIEQHGPDALRGFAAHYPNLASETYSDESLNLDEVLQNADVVLVHEWNSPELIARIGRHRVSHDYQLYFHDTHHRILTDATALSNFDLTQYDAVLAYGQVIRDAYLARGWARQAFTWHEAADTRIFRPLQREKEADLVWIGNWGDDERTASLREFLIEPVKRLGLSARVYGVRYPEAALAQLRDAGIEYRGWLPNYDAPEVFARHRVTVHVPRRPYVEALPGIPTIRPFEAMACAIPLVSSPWDDAEHLFRPGQDFLFAENGEEMAGHLQRVISDKIFAAQLAKSGLETIRNHHTCGHRVDQLLGFVDSTRGAASLSGALS